MDVAASADVHAFLHGTKLYFPFVRCWREKAGNNVTFSLVISVGRCYVLKEICCYEYWSLSIWFWIFLW